MEVESYPSAACLDDQRGFVGGCMGWMGWLSLVIGLLWAPSVPIIFESTPIPTDCHHHGNVCVSKSGNKDVKVLNLRITRIKSPCKSLYWNWSGWGWQWVRRRWEGRQEVFVQAWSSLGSPLRPPASPPCGRFEKFRRDYYLDFCFLYVILCKGLRSIIPGKTILLLLLLDFLKSFNDITPYRSWSARSFVNGAKPFLMERSILHFWTSNGYLRRTSLFTSQYIFVTRTSPSGSRK